MNMKWPQSIPTVFYFIAAFGAFVLSLDIFRLPYIFGTIGFILSAIWTIMIVVGFAKSDDRMPKLMIGLPFALFIPGLMLLFWMLAMLGYDIDM